ncbi:uncharacterized protein A4U43_C06F2680 [Asparagus officinalis]|uniref:Uncharacterized protein n=1 Tax=Asparagus officinalis TaxID=4686 RepID=A0A5P1EJM9_ASPOF|nr:uncharacterized protein A4U43_C06F2680 [Asparagus officinalis]
MIGMQNRRVQSIQHPINPHQLRHRVLPQPDPPPPVDEADAAGLVPTYCLRHLGTPSNAVDPVGPIADVAKEFGAWVHVDAAYAGSAGVCPEFRKYFSGLVKADSVSMSPHKWLLTCLDCTCLWVRDWRRLVESLGTDPEYLKNKQSESGSVVDFKDLQIGCGRPFRALKLFMVIQTYGSAYLQAHIRSDVDMASKQVPRSLARSDPGSRGGWWPAGDCASVCFPAWAPSVAGRCQSGRPDAAKPQAAAAGVNAAGLRVQLDPHALAGGT